jgi:hypothetical protein
MRQLDNVRRGELKRLLRHRGVSEIEVCNEVEDIMAERARWTAAALGQRMNLTFDLKIRFGIKTIACVDRTKKMMRLYFREAAAVMPPEYDSLRVAALDDRVTARQINWAVEDLPAGSLYAPRRGIYVVNIKVVKPEGSGHDRGFGDHSAHDLPNRRADRCPFPRCRRSRFASRRARCRKQMPFASQSPAIRASRLGELCPSRRASVGAVAPIAAIPALRFADQQI